MPTSEELMKMVCKHQTLFFGSGGYYIICAECSYMWVAKDPMSQMDEPAKDFQRLELTNKDIRIDPQLDPGHK